MSRGSELIALVVGYGVARLLLTRDGLADRPSDAEAPATPTVEQIPAEITAENYAVASMVIARIFEEFWQANAFFLTFASAVVASIMVNWKSFAGLPLGVSLGALIGFVYLVGIWLLTIIRHTRYIDIHMDHAVVIEARNTGLDVYSNRRAVAGRSLLPQIRKIWFTVPVLFTTVAIAMAGCVVAGVGGPDETHVTQSRARHPAASSPSPPSTPSVTATVTPR